MASGNFAIAVFGQDFTLWPCWKQFSQSPCLRANVSLCSMDCFLNWPQRVNQWSSLHKWHLDLALIESLRCSLFSLMGSLPRVAKCRGLRLLEVLPWFLHSVLMVPNTGWFKALAFDSTKLTMSSNVISLCLLFVISSATSHHLCLSGRETFL